MITKTFNGQTIKMSVADAVAVKYGRAYIDWSPPYPCVAYYRDKLPGAKKPLDTVSAAVAPVQYKDDDWVDYKAIIGDQT